MKTITIFGADGRTGLHLVNQALERGYKVTAFVFSKNNRLPEHELLTQIKGNVLSKHDVSRAITPDTDTVISALGHIKGSDPLMQTKGMKNIISIMERCKTMRLLSLTGTGARIKHDTPSVIDRLLNSGVAFF